MQLRKNVAVLASAVRAKEEAAAAAQERQVVTGETLPLFERYLYDV